MNVVLKQIIVKQINTIFFDIDGTLQGTDLSSVDLPTTLEALAESGFSLGLCTARTVTETLVFLHSLFHEKSRSSRLFRAGLVCEDGHVLADAEEANAGIYRIVTSAAALADMKRFKEAFLAEWHLSDDSELATARWGFLNGVLDPPVQLAFPPYDPKGSITIWEKGPAITTPAYQGQYVNAMNWVKETLTGLHLKHLYAIEAGNGTIRILQKGIDKQNGLKYWHSDLSSVAFVGDGPNDVALACAVKDAGGLVVAVENAVEELKSLADWTTNYPEALGVVEFARFLIESD
jgi:hydroxymethylpyrimidine pyrophosphatase-like HAD family hydrolase